MEQPVAPAVLAAWLCRKVLMTAIEQLAREIYAWQMSTVMYGPPWEKLTDVSRKELLDAAALPAEQRLAQGRYLTFDEAQKRRSV